MGKAIQMARSKIHYIGTRRRDVIIVAIILGVLSGFLIHSIENLIFDLGENTRVADPSTDYLFGIFWGIALTGILWIFPMTLQIKRALLTLWVVRCFVTLGIMLFYEANYGLDAYMYHERSFSSDVKFDGFTGTPFIISTVRKIHELIPLTESYHAMKVIFSFFGLLSALLLYKAFRRALPNLPMKMFYFLGLCPSILFWSSILGKDPLHFLGLAIYMYGLIGIFKTTKIEDCLIASVGLGLACLVRAWTAPILLIPLLVIGLIRHTFIFLPLLAGLLFSGVLTPRIESLSRSLKIESVTDLVDRTQKVSHGWNHGGSADELPEFTDVNSMIRFLPKGMFTALFRPLPGEVMNPFGIFAGIESLALLVLVFMSLWSLKYRTAKEWDIFYTVLVILIWGGIYAFISSQNLGTAFRFRLQVMPFFIYLIMKAYDYKYRAQS